MALQIYARPTPANLRTRLRILSETAHSLEHLARVWNPKGRYFVPRREMLALAQQVEVDANRLREILCRR